MKKKKLIIGLLVMGLLLVGAGFAQAQLAQGTSELTVSVAAVYTINLPPTLSLALDRDEPAGTFILDSIETALYCDSDVNLSIAMTPDEPIPSEFGGTNCGFGLDVGTISIETMGTDSDVLAAGDYPDSNVLSFVLAGNGLLDAGDYVRVCTVSMTAI